MNVPMTLITSSMLDLAFTSPSLEKKFQQQQIIKTHYFNWTILRINSVSFLLLFIGQLYQCYLLQVNPFQSSWLGVILLNFLLLFIIHKLEEAYASNDIIQKFVSVLYYIIYVFFFVIFRLSIVSLLISIPSIKCFIYYVDYLSKIIIVFEEAFDYQCYFIANCIVFILMKLVHHNQMNLKGIIFLPYLIEDSFILINIIMCYYTMIRCRYLFYYLDKVNKQNDWYKNLVNNMNSGLVTIANGSIIFTNQYFIDSVSKLGLITEEEKHNQFAITAKSKALLQDIFTRTEFLSDIIDNDLKITEMNKDFDCFCVKFFDKIKEYTLGKNKEENNEKSVYIGNIHVHDTTLDINLEYEFYGRYYITEAGDMFDLISNNVTRTKIIEEKNAEIRLKTAFLSKIAHEIKNPLICLSESIDEEFNQEAIDNYDTTRINTIQSIANYLLIIIKNIDFFSQLPFGNNNNTVTLASPNNNHSTQTTMNTNNTNTNSISNNNSYSKDKLSKVTFAQTSLSEVFNFISFITNYMIKKKTISEHDMTFNIINNTKYISIETDEVKLKQILINLISNGIKFTLKGSISLIVQEEGTEYIRFIVRDTGVGISEAIKSELFNPFLKSETNDSNVNNVTNIKGSGFGLLIARELALCLGNGLFFNSQPGQGTDFWFDLSVENAKSLSVSKRQSSSSVNTIKDEPVFSIGKFNMVPLSQFPSFQSITNDLMANTKQLTLIFADDEYLVRKSTIKSLKKYALGRNINLEILEATDGLETMWLYYDKCMKNETVDIIISDENMNFYSGSISAEKINELSRTFTKKLPKFYISSAYCSKESSLKYIDGFFHKPLLADDLRLIFTEEILMKG